MKKIVTLGAIAAVAGGMMFAQPVFEPSVTLDGSATAKWGVDLDAGQTGFQNDTSGDFKVKLWGDGSRELEEGDGVWAELKVTGKELTWNGNKEKDERWDGGKWELNEAKLHIGPVYVGVKSGDTQVGEYKFDGAIRSADNDNAKWLNNVGPDKFSQGIVVGFANDSFDLGVDFRSYYDAGASAEYEFDTATGKAKEKTAAATGTNTHYTSAYAIAAEAKIKDSNTFLPGLAVDVGVGYNLSDHYSTKGNDDSKGQLASNNYFGEPELEKLVFGYIAPDAPGDSENLKNAKEALSKVEAAFKDWKDGKPVAAAYAGYTSVAEWEAAITTAKGSVKTIEDGETNTAAANAAAKYRAPFTDRKDELKVHTLGYAFNASYKLKIDDKFYLKPAVGLTGTYVTAKNDTESTSGSVNTLVAGALFGWGDTADSDAGVYFLNDGDQTKKVTPGISVVAAIPLASTGSHTDNAGTTKSTMHSALQALIVPSVYFGDLIPNLKLAAYSEMALLRNYKEGDHNEDNTAYNYSGNNTEAWNYAVTKANEPKEARTFGLAAAFGVAYDIKATDDITITPKFGLRYANSAYIQNKVNKIAPLSNHALFEAGYGKMGVQQKKDKHEDGDFDNYLNIKFGLDAAGLISNTTFFVEYASANLLFDGEPVEADKNQYNEQNKYYSIKAGTLDVGCKISF